MVFSFNVFVGAVQILSDNYCPQQMGGGVDGGRHLGVDYAELWHMPEDIPIDRPDRGADVSWTGHLNNIFQDGGEYRISENIEMHVVRRFPADEEKRGVDILIKYIPSDGVIPETIASALSDATFLRFDFYDRKPWECVLNQVNEVTRLSPRQVEAITHSTVKQWISFVKRIAFGLVGVDMITLLDDASVFFQPARTRGPEMEIEELGKNSSRVLSLLRGSDNLSVYSKYGFISHCSGYTAEEREAAWRAAVREAHRLMRVANLIPGHVEHGAEQEYFRCFFNDFKTASETEQGGDIWAYSPALTEEYTWFQNNDVLNTLWVESLLAILAYHFDLSGKMYLTYDGSELPEKKCPLQNDSSDRESKRLRRTDCWCAMM